MNDFYGDYWYSILWLYYKHLLYCIYIILKPPVLHNNYIKNQLLLMDNSIIFEDLKKDYFFDVQYRYFAGHTFKNTFSNHFISFSLPQSFLIMSFTLLQPLSLSPSFLYHPFFKITSFSNFFNHYNDSFMNLSLLNNFSVKLYKNLTPYL